VKEFPTFIFMECESSFSIQPCLESVHAQIPNLKSVFEMRATIVFAELSSLQAVVVCLLCDAWTLIHIFATSMCLLVACDL
jgi:hypothetical protein